MIDEWVDRSIATKKRIDLLEEEEITVDKNEGLNRTSKMKYISVRDLTTCIARSRNATTLRSYAMNLMSIFRIYQEELITAKDNALEENEDKIDKLQRTIEQERITAQKRDAQQSAKIDKLLGHADRQGQKIDNLNVEIKVVQNQNEELKEDVKDLNVKIVKLTEEIQHLRSDISGYTRLLVKTCITPSVVSNLIELFSNGEIEFNNRSPHNGIQPCKIMYFAVFINNDNTELTFWLACRNFSEVPKRLNEQFNKSSSKKFLGAKAVAICDKDVNEEMNRFNKAFMKFSSDMNKTGIISIKEKTFSFEVNADDKVNDIIEEFAKRMRNQFLMRHQKGALLAIRNSENFEKLQAKEAFRYSISFNESIVTHTQNYVDSFFEMNGGVVERVLSASDITQKIPTDLSSANGKVLFVKKHLYYMYLIKREASRYQEEQYIREFAELQNQKAVDDDSDLADYDIDNFDDFSDPES